MERFELQVQSFCPWQWPNYSLINLSINRFSLDVELVVEVFTPCCRAGQCFALTGPPLHRGRAAARPANLLAPLIPARHVAAPTARHDS